MRREREEEELFEKLMRKLIRLADLFIARLESSPQDPTTLTLTIEGIEMANYQLNAGDSVVVTLTDTDNVTGAVVVPDAGSVTAVLSSSTDSIVANADGTYTITAGSVASTDNTVTANATVGGVASTAGVGTYDVVPAVVTPDATTLNVTFGTETAPAAPAAPAAADASTAGLSEAQVAAGFRNS